MSVTLTETEDALVTARAVLASEVDGIEALAAALDGGFRRAVETLSAVSGRVVVSGMGKSGHVGRKIAATLASTGTPALFVHPAEASHGDLGMILPNDAVLALSNSGETPELADLVGHSRRFGLPLIAITREPGSALAQQADVVLLLTPADLAGLSAARTALSGLAAAQVDAQRVRLVIRAAERGHGVTDQDVEAALGVKIWGRVPWDEAATTRSLNHGVPVVTAHVHSRYAAGVSRLLATLDKESR